MKTTIQIYCSALCKTIQTVGWRISFETNKYTSTCHFSLYIAVNKMLKQNTNEQIQNTNTTINKNAKYKIKMQNAK